MDIIFSAKAEPAGVVIALDRQEKGKGERSAIQEVEQDYNIPVTSIIRLENIYHYLVRQQTEEDLIDRIRQYRLDYGISE